MKPVILHLSNDYPDALAPDKTRAVYNLVEGTPEFRHVVYSLNRVDGWGGITALPFGEDRIAVAYRALPKGLLWEARLRDVANWILNDLKKNSITPDLIEAHKFTVEGLIGEQIAVALGKPLICDIQGDTDSKILRAKPNLHSRFRAIAMRAAAIFPYAHWPIGGFVDAIGLDRAKCHVLPVIPALDALRPSPVCPEPAFVTVFNLNSWERKNIVGVATAMQLLALDYPGLSLTVHGRGSPAALLTMQKALAATGMASRITIAGPVANGALPDVLGRYAGFVLPSRRETYGLVYAEALLCGLPLLFSRGRGIDGFFPAADIGYAADPNKPSDIAAGLRHLLERQQALKASIAARQASGDFDILRRDAILATYRRVIADVLGAGQPEI